jgi:hypothetical protein
MQLLAKNPAERPQSAPAVVEAIRDIEARQGSTPLALAGLAAQAAKQIRETIARLRRARRESSVIPEAILVEPAPTTPSVPQPSQFTRPPPTTPRRDELYPRRPRRRWRLGRILLILFIIWVGVRIINRIAFTTVLPELMKHPVVVETDNDEENFSVKIGDKNVLEVRGSAPKAAQKSAETYLKGHYANVSITSKKLADQTHAVFAGTLQEGDKSERFHLYLKYEPARKKWLFEKIDLEEQGE